MNRVTWSIPEMAEALGISKGTAYRLAKTKGFPLLNIGKRKVIPVEGLQEWIKKNSSVSPQKAI